MRYMRANKYIAQASGLSRREADEAIAAGRVVIDGSVARIGQAVDSHSTIFLDGLPLTPAQDQYIKLHKPVGYVCSRRQQDDKPTLFELLPAELRHLKVTGRLDADSRGLVVLTNDGDFANRLMHPRFRKEKVYEVKLHNPLSSEDQEHIARGVQLDDGLSTLAISGALYNWRVIMTEGRNRQIRRTFSELGYEVTDLFRIAVGDIQLKELAAGQYEEFKP